MLCKVKLVWQKQSNVIQRSNQPLKVSITLKCDLQHFANHSSIFPMPKAFKNLTFNQILPSDKTMKNCIRNVIRL